MCTARLALGGLRCPGAQDRPLRHHQRAQLGVGGQHAVEADEVQPPSPDTNSPVDCLCLARGRATGPTRPARGRGTSAASRCMHSSGDITRCVVPSRQGVLSFSTTCPASLHCTRSSVLRRAGDGAAQLLQRLAVIGTAAHSSMQAETVHVGTQRLLEVGVSRHHVLQGQHLLTSTRAKGDPVSARGGLQRPAACGLGPNRRRCRPCKSNPSLRPTPHDG